MRRIWLLRYLAASWFTTAVLYASPVPLVPRPMASFVLSTLVAAVAAAITPVVMPERPASAPPQAPIPRPPLAHRAADAEEDEVADWADRRHVWLALEPDATQCPGCGSFATEIVRGGTEPENACRTCDLTWTAGGPDSGPDVVIRSWLHR
jgi:hypothetical protein